MKQRLVVRNSVIEKASLNNTAKTAPKVEATGFSDAPAKTSNTEDLDF